jgi:hypothetical protein
MKIFLRLCFADNAGNLQTLLKRGMDANTVNGGPDRPGAGAVHGVAQSGQVLDWPKTDVNVLNRGVKAR